MSKIGIVPHRIWIQIGFPDEKNCTKTWWTSEINVSIAICAINRLWNCRLWGTVYWAGAKLTCSSPRILKGWCIEKALAAHGIKQQSISFWRRRKRKRAKFSAARKTFLHSQQERGADRTHFLFFCIPWQERSLTSPVSFALCSSRRAIVEAETYIERQMRLEIWSTQVVGIFSGVKRARFFLHRWTSSLACAKFKAPWRFVCLAND